MDYNRAFLESCTGDCYPNFTYTKDGMFTSDGTWEYKPLLANQIPTDFRVEFLKDSAFPLGIKGSKAVGEPPLLLSASIFTAVRRRPRQSA